MANTIEPFADDVTAASTSTKTGPESSGGEEAPADIGPVGVGPLLEEDPEKVIELCDGFWEDAEPVLAECQARWKANGKRREGVIGVTVVKPDPDKNEWKVWAPPGAARVPPTFNQPARLARRLKSNLFVDPPIPEVTPSGASDNDKPDAAEFQTRILQDVTTAPRFNVPEIAERAIDKQMTFDSGFVRVYVDPKGGGSRPKAIQASMKATSEADALYVDPPEETQPQEPPYVTRYVKEDGTLTDDPRLAAREWLPALRAEHLTGVHLRPIPASATTIEDCSGIIIRTPAKLSDLRDQYPDAIEALSTDELWELVNQRPANSQGVLNPADRQVQKKGDDKPPPDHAKVIVTMVYMGEGGSYPAGAYVVCAGTKTLLHRQKWEIAVNGVPETLPIPIGHFKGWEEGKDTFYGYGLMHFLGPGQEIRAATIGGAIEHLDRFNRRKTFYSPQSLFQPKANPAAMGLMVPIQPGSKPEVEEFPEYPNIATELLNLATNELNDESGLLPIAQGMTDPSVTSGLHAQKVIEQVNIGLGDIKRSTEKGIVRLWTIAAAFVRGYFTTAQQVRFLGDDQEYKQKDWSAADLSDAKDVRMMKGSFTMLAPSAKLAVAEYQFKLGLINQDQLRRVASNNAGGLLGLQDDPAVLRIRRQIATWESGPPKAEDPAEPMPDSFPGESSEPANQPAPAPGPIPEPGPVVPAAVAGPAPAGEDPSVVGSIAPPPPPAPDPMAIAGAQIFAPVPNDEEPAVATIRFQELSRAMCSKKYERQPQPWRAVFDAEYQRMRKAAGVGTAAEAAQNQAAAQKAQQDAEAQKRQADTEGKVATIQAQTQGTMATKGATDLQLEELKLEHQSVMKTADLEAKAAEPQPEPAIAGNR